MNVIPEKLGKKCILKRKQNFDFFEVTSGSGHLNNFGNGSQLIFKKSSKLLNVSSSFNFSKQ